MASAMRTRTRTSGWRSRIDHQVIRTAAAQAIKDLPDHVLAAMVRAADTNTVLALTWKSTEAPPEPVEDPAADLPDDEKDDDAEVDPITQNANDDEEEGAGEPPPEITDRDIKPDNVTERDLKPANVPEPEDVPPKIASRRPADGTATATETDGGWQGGMWVSGEHVTIGPVLPTKEGARRHALANPPAARRTSPPADGLNRSQRGERGRAAVLELLEGARPHGLSRATIVSATGLTDAQVCNHLQRLKSMGRCRLVGARRSARWFPSN